MEIGNMGRVGVKSRLFINMFNEQIAKTWGQVRKNGVRHKEKMGSDTIVWGKWGLDI